MRVVLATWWPLAASWFLMGIELPAVSAIMARLIDPEISLAAYGGVVFPLALIIESPIIMLLAASTALCQDWQSYRFGRRFMFWSAGILTLLHVLLAFTPLYEIVVVQILGAPADIVRPAQIGLQIMTPWTGAIAYRRFHQGILIRFGHSGIIGKGTLVRLSSAVTVLALGFAAGDVPGIIVGTSAVATGVVAEAIYVGIRVQPILTGPLRQAPRTGPPLTLGPFASFYVPLALTALISLLALPIGSAGMGRMPQAIESLATWPVVNGLVFVFRGTGIAFNEVVVAHASRPGAARVLWRFALCLATTSSLCLLVITATPLANLWLGGVSALAPDLIELGRRALWLTVPMPAHAFIQSFFQGILVHSRSTRGIPESVGVFLGVTALVLIWGITRQEWPGLYVGLSGVFAGGYAQLGWLWWRSRSARANLLVPRLHPESR